MVVVVMPDFSLLSAYRVVLCVSVSKRKSDRFGMRQSDEDASDRQPRHSRPLTDNWRVKASRDDQEVGWRRPSDSFPGESCAMTLVVSIALSNRCGLFCSGGSGANSDVELCEFFGCVWLCSSHD